MLLYEHPLSSYAQKVKIALREKGLDFTAERPADFGTGHRGGPLGQANPRAEVPVLIDGDVTLFESTVIMEYIEERWPEPPLLPRDPAARAFARMTEDVCDTRPRPDEAAKWRGCLNRGGRHRAIRDRGYVRFASSHIVSNIGSTGRETMPRTHVSHASEGAFQQVAPGISVRDLGIGDVTAGEFTAQVIRIEPEGAHVEALHQHEEGFSLAY